MAAAEIIGKANPRYKKKEQKRRKKEYWWNGNRKLRTEERRVVGKSPGQGAEKGDFQV